MKSLRIDNHLLFEKYNKVKEINKDMNNLDKNQILSSDTFDFFSIPDSEEKDLSNIFEQNNSQALFDYKAFDEKKEIELNEIITELKMDLKKEKDINNKLNLKINELEKVIKDKKEEIINQRKKKKK